MAGIINGVFSCAGVATLSGSFTAYQLSGPTPLCIGTGIAGSVLLILGVWKRSIPRGKEGHDLKKQTRFDGKGEYVKEKDEDGKEVQVYASPVGMLGLPLKGDAVKDHGVVTSVDKAITTTYDMILGVTKHDERPAMWRCIKPHTFKDQMKDGKPNPKPMIVDQPATWESLTYGEMKKEARAFGTCLRKTYGIAEKEKVAIWASNCVEWMLTDLACAAYNYTSVSVYDTLGPDAASYIVADSGAEVLVCEDKTFKKVPSLLEDEVYKGNAGAALKVVIYMGKGDAEAQAAIEKKGVKVKGFSEAVKAHRDDLEKDTKPSPDDIVTIMYTSGTTGMPKGVMLTHRNITATISMIDLTPALELLSDDVHLSYLPLAHILERQISCGFLYKGAQIYFASNGAKALLADLGVVRPTVFAGVPKVYENVRDAVKRKMTGFKKTLFEAAMKAKVADIHTGCGYHPLWDILVFSKTNKALGGRVRYCVTGGAPISKDTLEFVLCALAPVVQGYGATETSAVSALAMGFDMTLGHVGPPVGSSVIRLVDVPDMNYFSGEKDTYKDDKKAKAIFDENKNKNGGEVWIGGPSVSNGYYDPSLHGLKSGLPSNGMQKKTKDDFFTDEKTGFSWFKTGDIGRWSDHGCLQIVDRKKNMFKTSLGEYVPVEEVEKVYQDSVAFADFVFLPKETKVSYIALCVVVSDSIGSVMKWAAENGIEGDEKKVCTSDKFKEKLASLFEEAAKEKKLQRFMWVSKKNIHVEYLPLGYQEDWVSGVKCANGQKEQLLTATFKARRAQLDQYFAPHFKVIYPDRPADHVLP